MSIVCKMLIVIRMIRLPLRYLSAKLIGGIGVFSKISLSIKENFGKAKNNNLLLIPIGATGYMAQEIWEEVKNTYSEKDELYNIYLELGNANKSFEEILSLVLKFLQITK